jgi:hypothetical protein
MANNSIQSGLRGRIDAFLSEITGLVQKAALEAVTAALSDGAAPQRRGPGRPKGSGAAPAAAAAAAPKSAPARSKKRGKRTTEEVEQMAEGVLAYIKANPGQGLEAIGRGLGMPTKELKLPITKLNEAKALKTTGQRRGMKYFVAGAAVAKTATKAKAKGKKAKKSKVARKKK